MNGLRHPVTESEVKIGMIEAVFHVAHDTCLTPGGFGNSLEVSHFFETFLSSEEAHRPFTEEWFVEL